MILQVKVWKVHVEVVYQVWTGTYFDWTSMSKFYIPASMTNNNEILTSSEIIFWQNYTRAYKLFLKLFLIIQDYHACINRKYCTNTIEHVQQLSSWKHIRCNCVKHTLYTKNEMNRNSIFANIFVFLNMQYQQTALRFYDVKKNKRSSLQSILGIMRSSNFSTFFKSKQRKDLLLGQ